MVTHQEIERQLKAIGVKFTWWGKGEASELEHIIEPGESIMYCLNGRYEGGFAMLCVTDKRVIIIDKKPLFITLEDIRYDMISEVDFNGRLVDSSVVFRSAAKRFWFTSFKGESLRKATSYLQRKVVESNQLASSNAQATYPYLLQEQVAGEVKSFEHRITNPYTKVPLMMRRRVSRYYN